jgi:hypothetical protein
MAVKLSKIIHSIAFVSVELGCLHVRTTRSLSVQSPLFPKDAFSFEKVFFF